MGQHIQVEWQETAAELKQLYKQERHPQRRTRLQALWHLRRGDRIAEVVEKVGVAYRSVQNWLRWYRQGGLREVCQRVTGYHSQGAAAYLNALQQQALAAKVELGTFRTVWDAVQWVADRWGINYTYSGLHAGMQRLKCAPKVPRPQSVKADPKRQRWWQEQGLRDALQEAGMQREDRVWFCDEMRFGLWGQVRKRWGLRGVKIIQKVQIEFAWEYLVLAVDVGRCELRWD